MDKKKWYNPSNLVDALETLIDSGRATPNDDNPRAQIGWSLVAGYVLGNSLGTANTNKGRKRLNLGPVYIW